MNIPRSLQSCHGPSVRPALLPRSQACLTEHTHTGERVQIQRGRIKKRFNGKKIRRQDRLQWSSTVLSQTSILTSPILHAAGPFKPFCTYSHLCSPFPCTPPWICRALPFLHSPSPGPWSLSMWFTVLSDAKSRLTFLEVFPVVW